MKGVWFLWLLAMGSVLWVAASMLWPPAGAQACSGIRALNVPCRLVSNNGAFDEGWRLTIGLVALVVLLALMLAALDISGGPASESRFLAALSATWPIVPIIAAIGTVTAYIARYPDRQPWNRWLNDFAVPVGVFFALLAWLLLAMLRQRSTAADRANMHVYGELDTKLNALRGQLRDVCSIDAYHDPPTPPANSAADGCREAWFAIANVREELQSAGMRWVAGDGYTKAGEQLHRAEEALLTVQSRQVLLREALYDEMRLQGSGITQERELLAKLSRAVDILGGGSYLTPAPTSQTGTALRSPETDLIADALAQAQADLVLLPEGDAGIGPLEQEIARLEAILGLLETSAETREQIRALALVRSRAISDAGSVLAAVRKSVNAYRDRKRDLLVHARNDLLKVMSVAGVITYLLLAITVIYGVHHEIVIGGVVYFLVGALFGGALNELNERAGDEVEEVEDFRLSEARLLLTPLLSGLAAIGGVAATLIGAEVLAAAVADNGANGADDAIRLRDAFDPRDQTRFLIGLVVAAIFGLSPIRFINRLNNSASQAKIDLANSEPSNSQR